MSNVTPCLNSYLNTSFYWTDVASSPDVLWNWVKSDVDQGYAVLTGVYTPPMEGWNGHETYHIITLYGYDYSYQTTTEKMVNYVDTASEVAGYTGTYLNKVELSDLWSFVSPNNVQAW